MRLSREDAAGQRRRFIVGFELPTDSIYLVSPRRIDDTDETWARRQGVIRNVGRLDANNYPIG